MHLDHDHDETVHSQTHTHAEDVYKRQPQKRSKDNKLIISVALLFAFCGVCALLDISPLPGCMMMGTVYTNIADDDKLFKQLNYFSPPILLLLWSCLFSFTWFHENGLV